MIEDPVMARIADAIAMLHSGDPIGARQRFAAIWAEIKADPDPLHQCTLAHYMADTQESAAEELRWDLLALDAADRVTQARAEAHDATLQVRSFYPSLHLNVADGYRRQGDFGSARRHLDAGRSCLDTLPENGYGAAIRAGLDRLAVRLDAAEAAPPATLQSFAASASN